MTEYSLLTKTFDDNRMLAEHTCVQSLYVCLACSYCRVRVVSYYFVVVVCYNNSLFYISKYCQSVDISRCQRGVEGGGRYHLDLASLYTTAGGAAS